MVRDEGLRFRLTQREQTGTLASVPPAVEVIRPAERA
jgi:hypothetical protein